MRRQASLTLEQIDANGTQPQREFINDQISGTLRTGRTEYLNKYQGNITNYARNFTAKNKTYAGLPEAIALAHHLQREIAIITPQSEAEQQRLLAMHGNYYPTDMVFVCLPNLEFRVRKIL